MKDDARHFNNNSRIYSNVRPGYPDEIYNLISQYKEFSADSNILEIGAGNGIASQEIYNKWHPKLTLIEPGHNLYEILCETFSGKQNIKIENTTFEQYVNKELFDAVFRQPRFIGLIYQRNIKNVMMY